MTALTYLIPILIFGVTLIVILGVIQYASYMKRHRDLLRKIEEEGLNKREIRNLTLKERARQVFLRVTRSLGGLAKPKGEEEISQFRRRLMHAGLSRFKNIVMMFYGSKVLLMILLPVLFVLFKFSFFTRIPPIMFMLIIIVLALAGFYLPELWLKIRTNSRKDQISRGFPDALDLMVICVEAGMGLDSTFNRVGEEMKLRHPALSEEMKILMLELRAGMQRRDALKNLAMRTDSEDVQSFVTLLIQTEKFGTNVAQAMRVLADSMRTQRALKVEQLAATLAVKLLFPTILLIFPSLFLVLMGPALMRAFRMWKG